MAPLIDAVPLRERRIHERERAAREALALRKVTVIDTRKVGELFERGLARLGVLEGLRTLDALLWEEAFVYPVGLSEVGMGRGRERLEATAEVVERPVSARRARHRGEAEGRHERRLPPRDRSRHARFADG